MATREKVMGKILGLDLGMASVGWCLVEEKKHIIALGSRVFNKAEDEKGASLNATRREARIARRRLRRRRHRLDRLRRFLLREKVISQEEADEIKDKDRRYDHGKEDPWKLRAEGLKRRLSGRELALALLHIAKRRGFKSTRRVPAEDDKETGKMLSGVKRIREEMKEKGRATVGQMFYEEEDFAQQKRNKGGEYLNTSPRGLLEEEVEKIFSRQRELGNTEGCSEEKEKRCREVMFYQRTAIEDVESSVGKCSLEPGEKRAPKAAYTAQLFVLYQSMNHLKIHSPDQGSGEGRLLNEEERKTIFDLCHRQKEVTYSTLRKTLGLREKDVFAGVKRYEEKKQGDKEKKQVDEEKKKKFATLEGWHALRKAVEKHGDEGEWKELAGDRDRLDILATGLTYYKTDEKIEEYLRGKGISKALIDAVIGVHFSQFHHLSLLAMKNILPHLESGVVYSEACERAGYDFHGKGEWENEEGFLPQIPFKEIRNPVVYRAVSQCRKVVNALIREHGRPEAIHVELARELAQSKKERDEIEKGQKAFRDNKEGAKKHFQELFGTEPNGLDLLKFRLWKNQEHICIYTGRAISSEDMRSRLNDLEVDHILPHSRTYDDSLNNKILCWIDANREKGNRTPREWLGGDAEKWDAFVARVKHNSNLKGIKKSNLLKENLDEKKFKDRNLNDTRYIARFMADYLRCLYEEDEGRRVRTVNGKMTAHLRTRWRLHKDREDGDRHHALDAAVLTGATDAMVKAVSEFHRDRDFSELRESRTRKKCPAPWEGFREELTEKLKAVFVSRMPRRRVGGAAHKDTIYSQDKENEKVYHVHKPLNALSPGELERIYRDRASYGPAYRALAERLRSQGIDPATVGKIKKGEIKKIFSDPLEIPGGGGKMRRIRVDTGYQTGLILEGRGGGLVEREGMVRLDVFRHGEKKKYYAVPLYVADGREKVLPNKAFTQGRQDGIEMDEDYEFLFSLHRNDLVEYERKGYVYRGYYAGFNRRGGQIKVRGHDNRHIHRRPLDGESGTWEEVPVVEEDGIMKSIGIMNMGVFRKLDADLLGGFPRPVRIPERCRRPLAPIQEL